MMSMLNTLGHMFQKSENSYLCTHDLYGPPGWALEIETFLGRVKWHRAVKGTVA